MLFDEPGRPLRPDEVADPVAGPGQLLIEVHACGVCRTDLHIVDGEVAVADAPVIPGHQIVGTVAGTDRRVGVPWLGWTCGACRFCLSGRENLCDRARFTGRDIDGGFAELAVADERYCFPLPDGYPDLQAAPLLCAGLIGYRALRFTGDAQTLGLYGFGAAAHIVCQVAVAQGRTVFAFTRETGDEAAALATGLGATWAGASSEEPPEPLDAAIIFAPAGELVPAALRGHRQGRDRGLRGHPHVRHPSLPLRAALGRAHPAVGGQPDPGRRRRPPGDRPERAGQDQRADLPAGRRQPGARGPARRAESEAPL